MARIRRTAGASAPAEDGALPNDRLTPTRLTAGVWHEGVWLRPGVTYEMSDATRAHPDIAPLIAKE